MLETNKYDLKYFIEKFVAIPDDEWTTNDFENYIGQRCALGHCGFRKGQTSGFAEGDHLMELLGHEVVAINDGVVTHYKQKTPKQRILAALKDIREK
mgnify:CR=1 FL=1